jgi:hypothetical protein
MNLSKSLAITFLGMWLLLPALAYSQNCQFELESEVKNSDKGSSNGEIIFKIKGDLNDGRYKAFLLNKGFENAKKELTTKKISGLKEGYYEFIIVDTKGDKCFREVTIFLKEN